MLALLQILAHSNLVSGVCFAPSSGEYLATASFDRTAKLWSARDWSECARLEGHSSRIMGLDVWGGDDTHIVTSSYDRTFKVWANEKEF